MMRYAKSTLCVALVLASLQLFVFSVGGVQARQVGTKPISWYTKRNAEHKAPVLDGDLRVIRKHKALYCDEKAAEQGSKTVYLTFDVGYENGNVEKILDTLREKEVVGAFFVLSHFVGKNPELVKRMTKEGHLICNHTAHHKDMSRADEKTFAQELSALEECVLRETGQKPAPFYRPPEGRFTEQNLQWAEERGYTTVFWSLCYADWDNGHQPQKRAAMHILCDNIHPGAVVLLHPTSATNAAIMGELIDRWRSEGYTFGSLTDVLP